MEPEIILPCPQQPATRPYSEPDESNPHRHSLGTALCLIVIWYSYYFYMLHFTVSIFFNFENGDSQIGLECTFLNIRLNPTEGFRSINISPFFIFV
jgi:hypothetical protein